LGVYRTGKHPNQEILIREEDYFLQQGFPSAPAEQAFFTGAAPGAAMGAATAAGAAAEAEASP